MSIFQSVMLTGESRPPYGLAEDAADGIAAYCAQAAKLGVTHLQVNHLPDPYHVILDEEPDNHYAWFADYGPALDQFVSSDLNRGLYPASLIAKNLAYLMRLAEAAEFHRLKPVLMLCEPRFVPERFFETHPELRGPRVDNPYFSDVPWYAMCTNHPVVREHYQQMLTRLMQHVPSLAGISIFTHDSGAGFCHSRSLYAGPNGCHRCRRLGAGERIADFLGLLQSVGAQINPDFRVSLATGVEDEERGRFLTAAPQGVTGEVQGAWSWLGGLEDQWAWNQHGSAIEKIGYAEARREREEEFADRLGKVKACDKSSIAICSMPTDGFYLPIRYVPHPFQNLQILTTLHEMGVEHLNCKGALALSDHVCYDINRESFTLFLQHPKVSAEDIVFRIATRWIGDRNATALVEVWRLLDDAHRQRCLWCWALPREMSYLPGPLVPAPDLLDSSEYAYADHPGLACIDRMHHRHRLESIKRDETERAWMLAHNLDAVLPRIMQAINKLTELLSTLDDEEARACVAEQLLHAQHNLLWQRSIHNWCEAGCWLAPGKGKPSPRRTLQAVIDDEIELTESLVTMYEQHPGVLFATAPIDGLLYTRGPGLVGQLKQRIEVMRNHRHDAPSAISLEGVSTHTTVALIESNCSEEISL